MMWSIITSIFFVWFVILPCTVRPINHEEFQKEVSCFNEILQKAVNNNTPYEERCEALADLKCQFNNTLENVMKNEKKWLHCETELFPVKEHMKKYDGMIKWWTCINQLKYRMEVFPINFGISYDGKYVDSPGMRGAIKDIQRVLKIRTHKLHDLAYRLKELHKNCYAVTRDAYGRHTGWPNKVGAVYREIKKIPITTTLQNKIKPRESEQSLSSLLVEFQTANNESDAVELLEKECNSNSSYWYYINLEAYEENDEIKQLALQVPENERLNIIRNHGKKYPHEKLEFQEVGFIADLFKFGTYFITNSYQYESCIKIFYFVPKMYSNFLREELTKKWPNLNHANAADKFCSIFAKLYDRISQSFSNPPSSSDLPHCMFNSSDFYQYIGIAGSIPEIIQDYHFVASCLGFLE